MIYLKFSLSSTRSLCKINQENISFITSLVTGMLRSPFLSLGQVSRTMTLYSKQINFELDLLNPSSRPYTFLFDKCPFHISGSFKMPPSFRKQLQKISHKESIGTFHHSDAKKIFEDIRSFFSKLCQFSRFFPDHHWYFCHFSNLINAIKTSFGS